MKKDIINITKTRENATIPTYGSQYSAGADLYACIDGDISIAPGKTVMIPTGIAMEIPQGYGGFVFARSGIATKRGLAPANKVGVIDSDYRGEIMVSIHNHGLSEETLSPGERIAQIVFLPVLTAQFALRDRLEDTERGSGGFGSTGR